MIAEGLKTKPQLETIIVKGKGPIDLIIIGGGPAGLTAGIYASRYGLDALLIEKALPGGAVSTNDRIENYPGFPEGISGALLAKHLEDQAKKMGQEIYFGTVTEIKDNGPQKNVLVDGKTFTCSSLIIATGTEPQKLGTKGEDAFRGRGVSYCAICDGPFYKDKKVAVIGGGNAAVEEAIFLTKFAKLVTIIHRRDELRADKTLELEARGNPKIYFLWDSKIEEIKGADKVAEIVVSNIKTNKKSTIECNGIFIYIGTSPNTSFLKGQLKLDQRGFIITDEEMRTSHEGIFAAGDVRSKQLRQVITAASDGAIAAESTRNYLKELKK